MTQVSGNRPLKKRLAVLTCISGLHAAVLTLLASSPGMVTPPKALSTVQGVLIATSMSPEPVRSKAVPQPTVPRLTPVMSAPFTSKVPPSERAISLPPTVAKAAPEDAPPAAAASREQTPPAAAATRSSAVSDATPVTQPRIDAGHLNNPAPDYPALSRRLNEQGRVLLDVLILPNGTVGEIRLKTSSSYPRLDAAALNAVKRWRYQPARRGATPIAYWYVQPVVFSLHK